MSSRPLSALASLVLAVLGIVFLLPPQCASACSCAGNPSPPASELSAADAVFSGEVVDYEKPPLATTMMEGTWLTVMTSPHPATVTLRVSEVWKGPEHETLEVSTPSDGVLCGYPFKEGQEYLVYAYGRQDRLEVDLCSTTKPLLKAGADLEVLGAGKTPKGGEASLSDTSGGVSAGAMVGMTGLLVAASFLVVVRLVRTG